MADADPNGDCGDLSWHIREADRERRAQELRSRLLGIEARADRMFRAFTRIEEDAEIDWRVCECRADRMFASLDYLLTAEEVERVNCEATCRIIDGMNVRDAAEARAFELRSKWGKLMDLRDRLRGKMEALGHEPP